MDAFRDDSDRDDLAEVFHGRRSPRAFLQDRTLKRLADLECLWRKYGNRERMVHMLTVIVVHMPR